MSDESTPAETVEPQGTQEAAAPKPTAPSKPENQPEPPAREETDWKAESRKWEQRAKENLAALMPIKEQFDALSKVFGDKSGKEQSPQDVVASLQQQVSQMQHDNLVNNVARLHGITDDEDVELLRTATSQEQMTRLAARLKAPEKPAPLPPDPGQGARPGTQSTEDAEYQQYYPTR